MEKILESLAAEPELIIGLIAAPMGILMVMFVSFLFVSAWIRNTREREQSRREIAAYVAEGSLTSQDAETLLQPRPWYSRSASDAMAKVRNFNPCGGAAPKA